MVDFRRVRLWLRALFLPGRVEEELKEEMLLHLEMEVGKNIRAGMGVEEARRKALLDFGGVERFKEQTREARDTRPLEDVLTDLRYGLRQLRKHPGFTVVALLSLALGIGANTAIFSVVNAVLLCPLPFHDPDRILVVEEWATGERNPTFSPRDFLDLKEQAASFQHFVGYRALSMRYMGSEGPERIDIQSVTPDFFQAFGVQPSLGRFFEDSPEENGAGKMVVLSNGSWKNRFGGDESILGRTLSLDGKPHTVVGVAPASFRFPEKTEMWVRSYRDGVPEPPIDLGDDLATVRGAGYFSVLALLAPARTFAQAQAEMDLLAMRLAEVKEMTDLQYGLQLKPLQESMVGDVRTALLVLLAAVGLVLLIACANVANLLLARAATRTQELAVRASLGATRRRLFRQLLVESLLLGMVAGVAGLALARWGFGGLLALLPSGIPRLEGITLDGGVLLFTLGASLVTGLFFGLMPALEASRTDLAGSIKEGGRGTVGGGKSKRSREMLVVAEVALSVVLLAGAGLLLKSLTRLQEEDVGFDPAGVLVLRMTLPESRYPKEADLSGFARDLVREVESLPGVRSAGLALGSPFGGGSATLTYEAEGLLPEPGEEFSAGYQAVSAGFMATLGVPLLAGRELGPADEEGDSEPQVVLVNEAFARQRWGGVQEALGRGIRFHQDEYMRIVGVVGNLRRFGFDQAPVAEAYTPFLRDPWPFLSLVVKAQGDPRGLIGPVREVVLALDPEQPVYGVKTMEGALSESVGQERFTVQLLGLFAALALVLAVVGVYGLMAYSVSLRVREIGIRVALGASRGSVMWTSLRGGVRLAVFGLGIGLAGALTVTRLMRSLLYGVSPTDPLVLVGALGVLAVAVLAAAWLPARKAAGTEPARVLRRE
jgi:predicted permease